jgi:hypothetical protein
VHVAELTQIFVSERNDGSVARTTIESFGTRLVGRNAHQRVHANFFDTVVADSRRLGNVITSDLERNGTFVKTSREVQFAVPGTASLHGSKVRASSSEETLARVTESLASISSQRSIGELVLRGASFAYINSLHHVYFPVKMKLNNYCIYINNKFNIDYKSD